MCCVVWHVTFRLVWVDTLQAEDVHHLDDSLKVELSAIPQSEFATLGACDAAPTLWRPDE